MYKVINNFNKVNNSISKKTCRPGDEAKYYKLLRNYRGTGFYLPKYDDDIDRRAIKKNMHHFKKKIKYLKEIKNKLKKQKKFIKFELLYVELESITDQLLDLKKQYHEEIKDESKVVIFNKSSAMIERLKKQFTIFLDQIYFLKSYNFPNDYLANRRLFEDYKYNKKNVRKSNEVYFYRKITEDGALDPNLTRPDKYFRTTLDTLYLTIQKEQQFLSENVRYDLEWIGKKLKRMLKRGKKVQLARIDEWLKRTQANYNFYREIIKSKNKKKSKFIVKKDNEASRVLREFVYKKQALVYEHWQKESELNKALYSLETILVNEVGILDGKHGLERAAVAEVVLNRHTDDFYNQLSKEQPIYNYINENIDKDKEHWLNVLFKIGEFSFTYHYIPGAAKIFCPDMSRRGKGIRNKNLKIILKTLKTYDKSFDAFRYYSRISMLGKIDMSSVWSDYKRIPELIGYESLHQRRLMTHYQSGKYKYYYSFFDRKGVEYNVVHIKDKTYSMRWEKGKPKFYDYRNPHLFAYFSKKN
jgi:hypothetical protein